MNAPIDLASLPNAQPANETGSELEIRRRTMCGGKGKIAAVIYDDRDVQVFGYEADGWFIGMAFAGKSAKAVWRFRFNSAVARQRKIDELVASRRRQAAMVQQRRAERAQPISLAPGDVLSSSWGYDQTNVEFWEVIRIVGSATVEVRQLGAHRVYLDALYGTCTPHTGEARFAGAPLRCRVTYGNRARVHEHSDASPWDGKPERWSDYA